MTEPSTDMAAARTRKSADHGAGTDVRRRTAVSPRKASRQRTAVFAFLDGQETFRSAQEIYAHLRGQGNAIGLATVYRALQGMVEDREVDVLRTDDGEAVYRRCGTGHHHHLVCRSCGRTVEVEDGPVERWAARVGTEHGFADIEHQVEVFGVCSDCSPPR